MPSNRIKVTTLLWVCVVIALVAGCSSAHQSVSPVPAVQQPALHGLETSVNSLGPTDEAVGSTTTVTVNIVVTIPPSAPTTKSIFIEAPRPNGITYVNANLTPGSPGCSGSPLVCTIPVSSVPVSGDAFYFRTYSSPGSEVAEGTLFQRITTTSTTVHIILAGTPAAITLVLQKSSPQECWNPRYIPLYVMVMDSSANVIIGSYGETVTLSDSDTSGKTDISLGQSFSGSSITYNPLVSYNGFQLKSATFSASASTVPASAVTNAVLKPLQMIYVANGFSSGGKVLVFPSNANGNISAARTITGGNMSKGTTATALDGSCNLYVLEGGDTIDVFHAGANGNATPIRTMTDSTNLSNPTSIAVDSAANVWVSQPAAGSNVSKVVKYAAGASGNVAPIADIEGSNTNLGNAAGVVVGPSGKIYAASGQCCTNNIDVFAAGANGNASPIQTINANSNATSIGLDSSNKIYLADGSNNLIQVFAANATGSATPLATISGTKTMLADPTGLALSNTNTLFVFNFGNGSTIAPGILGFPSGLNGNVSPHTNISGSNTGFIGNKGGGLAL